MKIGSPPQVESAGKALRKGVQLDDRNFVAHLNLGTWFSINATSTSNEQEKKTLIIKAIESFNRSISINPSYGLPYAARAQEKKNLGGIEANLAKEGRGNEKTAAKLYEEALADANHAIELHPENWELYYIRASIHNTKGNFNKTNADFVKILQLSPRKGLEKLEPVYLETVKTLLSNTYKNKDLDILKQEIYEPTKFMTAWALGEMLYNAGHNRLARDFFEGPISEMENAKQRLQKNGKTFSPATIKFLQSPLISASKFPKEWKDLKLRVEKLGIPKLQNNPLNP